MEIPGTEPHFQRRRDLSYLDSNVLAAGAADAKFTVPAEGLAARLDERTAKFVGEARSG